MRKFKKVNIVDVKTKTIITIALVVSFLTAPAVGFLPMGAVGFNIRNNLLYVFCHANIFHLICNLICIWLLHPHYYIVESFLLSFVASLLPEYSNAPIMGLSGFLFVMIGIKYGVVGKIKQLVQNTWLFFIVTALLPNIACLFHFYCVSLGYLYGIALSFRERRLA